MFTLPVSQEDIKEADPKVIILSGGPESIYLDGSPTLPVPPHIPISIAKASLRHMTCTGMQPLAASKRTACSRDVK